VTRAVDEALAHNPSVRSAEAAVAEGEARFSEARASRFPRLALSEAWQRGNDPVFVFGSLLSARSFGVADFAIDTLNHPDPRGRFRSTIAIEQILLDFGRRRAWVNGARDAREVARLDLERTRASVSLAVVETYGQLVGAESEHRAIEAAVEAASADRVRAANRRDAGMATDADVLALDARIADLEQRRIARAGDAAIARAALNTLTGAAISRPFTSVEPAAVDVPSSFDIAALLAEADTRRPEIRTAAVQRDMARSAERSARASLLPETVLVASVDVSGTTFSSRRAAWLMAAETRWTLSLGGAERARLKAAAAARARADADGDEARAAAHLDVVSAAYRLRSADARVAAGRASLAQAREAERIIRERVDAGLATVTDLLHASAAVLSASTAHSAALVEVIVTGAALRRALGQQP
jgi:outer membrane protein TolC